MKKFLVAFSALVFVIGLSSGLAAEKCGASKCGDAKAKTEKCGASKCGDAKADKKAKCGASKCGDAKADKKDKKDKK